MNKQTRMAVATTSLLLFALAFSLSYCAAGWTGMASMGAFFAAFNLQESLRKPE